MISIGDFARLGRVSVRMLRHYDTIGLLRPEYVDPGSGYRYYRPGQLGRLNRIVALKDLGLRLDQVRAIVDEQLTGDPRHAAAAAGRARGPDPRRQAPAGPSPGPAPAHRHGGNHDPSGRDHQDRPGGGRRRADRDRRHRDPGGRRPGVPGDHAAPRGGRPRADRAEHRLVHAAPEVSEDALHVHVTFPVAADSVPGLERVEIPAAEVASAIHRGPIEGVDAAYQLLHTWVRDHGLTDTGRGREVYLECPDDASEWITEVQVEFTRRI